MRHAFPWQRLTAAIDRCSSSSKGQRLGQIRIGEQSQRKRLLPDQPPSARTRYCLSQTLLDKAHAPTWSDNESIDHRDPTPAAHLSVHGLAFLERLADPQTARRRTMAPCL